MKRLFIVAFFCLVCNVLMAQNNASPVYQHGNKVYIPYSDKDVAQRAGAMKLRELISKDHLRNVVENEKDAQFVLDFVYSEKGVDHGFVKIKDRNGNLIAPTPTIKDSGRDLVEKGETIAETVYEKYVSRIGTELKIEDGRLLISGRRRGFVLRPEIGGGICNDGFEAFHVSAAIAYQFNPIIVFGGCLSGEKLAGDQGGKYYSVCVNFRTYFCDKKWSPFFDIKAGACIHNGYYWDYNGFSHSNHNLTYRLSSTFGWQYKKIDLGCSFANYALDTYSLTLNVAYNLQLKKKL